MPCTWLKRAVQTLVGVVLLAATALVALPNARAVEVPAHLRVESVVAEANFPVALAWTPDGRLLYTEKSGALRVVENGQLRDEPFAVFEVDDFFERGLLGLAVDPDFAANGYIYVYYTRADTAGHRIVRLREVDGRGVEPTILLDEPNPTGAAFHNGGNLHFGPDGYLYVTLGENHDSGLSQRLDTPLGKILRIDKADGRAPPDNPFYDDGDPASANDDRIWAL
ncbi:MAG: PQQ-dependent sugar dehydrogenase, partial [Chloroflexi bacterium]|nr:PQQ-dependent sugar dehydrogenase [Chloroflexota bacterium]